MDTISDFEVFRAIVDAGGISAAAEALQSSPPAVSRRLAALEEKLGVRLAERQSRRFRLTDEGLLLYDRACAILEQIREAEAEVASRGGAARGILRIGAPCEFGSRYIAPMLAGFSRKHPALDAHLTLSDCGLEVSQDGFDLVLRFGLPEDIGMIARRIASTPRVLCAAPSYLATHGVPQVPSDLANHKCLRFSRRHRIMDLWTFVKGDEEHSVKVCGSLSGANGDVIHDWALAGEGLSLEARWDVADDLASGRLVEVLPDYRTSDLDLYAVFAPAKTIIPRIRLFVDYVVQEIGLLFPRVPVK
jgi:LysR family transcriptional regulator, transcriptional activator for dmlA